MDNKKNKTLKLVLVNSGLVLIAFLIINLIKYQGFVFYRYTSKILFIILISNLYIKLTIGNIFDTRVKYFHGLMTIIKQGIFLVFLISFFIVLFRLYALSRLFVFGTAGLVTLLEIFIYTIRTFFYSKDDIVIETPEEKNIGLILLIISVDMLLWSLVFFILNKIDVIDFVGSIGMQKTFLVLTGLWLWTSWITQKFTLDISNQYWHLIAPPIKTVVLIGTGTAFFRFFLDYISMSNYEILYFLLFFLLSEILLISCYYLLYRIIGTTKDYEGNINVSEVVNEYDISLDNDVFAIDTLTQLVESKHENNTIHNLQELIDFIAKIPKLQKVKHNQTLIQDTEHLFNIEKLVKHSLHLFINLHKVNDFPAINKYFLAIYRKLVPGGYFVTKVKTIDLHREKFFQTYPKYISHIFYFFHFLFNRIFPYIPFFNKIHYLLTRGRRSVVAKAEVLGRLYYCGYKVVSTHEIGDFLYFVSQKSKFPALTETPSTSLIIRLKRVGMNGKMFNLYKFRTMYPYSEFLQEYIYTLNSLNTTGKILEDFRITGWGRILRRLWMDELPQLFNFLRGDIGIFGVRALSQQYFSLYPPRLRAMRIQFKNGLVPPYYADMPKNFSEIVQSEENYLQKKKTNPLVTDIVYFTKAMKNIMINNARSS